MGVPPKQRFANASVDKVACKCNVTTFFTGTKYSYSHLKLVFMKFNSDINAGENAFAEQYSH